MRIIIFFQVLKYDRKFLIQFKIDITISMYRTSIFSNDMTIISYFNIILNIIIITNPTFSRALKIFIAFFSHRKLKYVLYHVTAIFTFFDHTTNKIVNNIFAQVCFKKLTKLIINIYLFIAVNASNVFLIFARIRFFWILLFIIFWH